METSRIAVITDVHANLPALEAALSAIRADGCEAIVHTGDAIGIGPYPAECLDRLLHTPQIRLITGNHDAWFGHGLPPLPPYMNQGEYAHHHWVHAQLDNGLRSVVAGWPWAIGETLGGARVVFTHYALDDEGAGFAVAPAEPSAAALDSLFASRLPADVIIHGHDHARRDLAGRTRFINPGSLGCSTESVARYLVLEPATGSRLVVHHRTASYDRTGLMRAFEEREVPERAFIRRAFFGK